MKSTTNGDHGDGDTKPLTTFAPPPFAAVFSIILFVSTSLWYFPFGSSDDLTDPNINAYTRRVFPEFVSVEFLLYTRVFFTLVCFYGFITAWVYPPEIVTPPYRPNSKVAKIPIHLNGFKKNWTFTGMSWNLLGVQFGFSSYITYRQLSQQQQQQQQPLDPFLLCIALTLWEVTAPMTLLIGAIVKYALWPAQVKSSGTGGPFLRPRALLQHNANVVMAVCEVALLGGLPLRFQHISVSVLYGCAYILFTWLIQMRWRDGDGPSFIYFFMDTTLGWEHTIALYALLVTLMVFHGLFCGVESILDITGNNLVAHVGLATALCFLVCRFRD